jgi:hypothetical protein
MSLVLQSSGGGQITIQEPTTASNFTQNLSAVDGTILTSASQSIPSAALPVGSVLQVVSAITATQVSNSTSTPVDTGLTATITPKFATSKILVLVSQNGLQKTSANSSNCIDINLLRGATSLLTPNAVGALLETGTALALIGSASIAFLDSPATTSATTYKTQFASRNGAASVLVQYANISNSTITLLEIAA